MLLRTYWIFCRKLSEPGICHFLRLPIEIRLQIYTYTHIGGHTIEVLNLPIIQTSRGTQCYRTYSANPIDHQLLYRLKLKEDERYINRTQIISTSRRRWLSPGRTSPSEQSSSSELAKRKRCFSVYGLFSLSSVCRQTRADLQMLVYELNTFTFTDGHYNYSRAIRAFTRSLTERKLSVIHTIYWPLVTVLVYRRSLRGEKVEEPESACAEELRALKGFKRVVLRYGGPEFNSLADKHNKGVKMELRGLPAANGRWDYALEREFRGTLAVRAVKALIARDDVTIECEKTWRAAF